MQPSEPDYEAIETDLKGKIKVDSNVKMDINPAYHCDVKMNTNPAYRVTS